MFSGGLWFLGILAISMFLDVCYGFGVSTFGCVVFVLWLLFFGFCVLCVYVLCFLGLVICVVYTLCGCLWAMVFGFCGWYNAWRWYFMCLVIFVVCFALSFGFWVLDSWCLVFVVFFRCFRFWFAVLLCGILGFPVWVFISGVCFFELVRFGVLCLMFDCFVLYFWVFGLLLLCLCILLCGGFLAYLFYGLGVCFVFVV